MFTHFSTVDDYESEPGQSNRPGISIDILKVREPNTNTEHGLNFIDEALSIFGEAAIEVEPTKKTFPGFIEFLMKVSNMTGRGYSENMSRADKIEFFSTFSREDAPQTYFLAKSFFVKSSFAAENFEEAHKILLQMPASGGIFIDSEQGAIAQRRPNESAYVHRDALFNFKIFIETEHADEFESSKFWMNQFYESVKFMDSGKTYQNYPEVVMDDYLQRYYGDNLERLIEIKRKWDPEHYFNSKMSLPIHLP